MFDETLPDEWLLVVPAHSHLRRWFRTLAAFKHHLANREENGLAAADAVRMSPLGKLLVNPQRVRAWVLSEATTRAA